MTAKDKAKSFGKGLWTATSMAADLPTRMRITEIDRKIEELQKEREDLKEKLITPMD